MSKIPEEILQDGVTAYVERFLNGPGSLGDGIEAAYFAIHDHADWVRAGPQEWSGEGPPPVGIKVMTDLGTVMTECEVIGYYQKRDGGESWVVVALPTASKESRFIADRLVSQVFPVRTADQVAAEEKKAAIEQTIKDLKAVNGCGWYSIAEDLYDAGYRKQGSV